MKPAQIGLEEWGSALPDTGIEVFHRPEVLRVLEEHATGEMRLYAGYKGGSARRADSGLRQKSGARHGSVLATAGDARSASRPRHPYEQPKQRKRESVDNEFTDLLIEELDLNSPRTLCHAACPLDYEDPLPFTWAGMSVEPTFTYVIDLQSRNQDKVLNSYTRSLRKEIRDMWDLDVDITTEGTAAVRRIHVDVADRYGDQGEHFAFSQAYVGDHTETHDERCRTYVVRSPEGEFLSGIIVLYSNDYASF